MLCLNLDLSLGSLFHLIHLKLVGHFYYLWYLFVSFQAMIQLVLVGQLSLTSINKFGSPLTYMLSFELIAFGI